MNFLRRIFSVCHSFRHMCQSGRMKGFERCLKVEDQGTWRRQNLYAAILGPPAKRIQIKLYEPQLGKEKPVMGNIEPLLGITKPSEGLNKPCQGNVNFRKSFAAKGFNVKIPFISQTYTKAVAISFRQSHTRTRNLVKYHPSGPRQARWESCMAEGQAAIQVFFTSEGFGVRVVSGVVRELMT